MSQKQTSREVELVLVYCFSALRHVDPNITIYCYIEGASLADKADSRQLQLIIRRHVGIKAGHQQTQRLSSNAHSS